MRTGLAGVVVVVAAFLAACSADPEALKREHLKRGQDRAAEKKYPEAIIEYQTALQADPKFGEAYLALGHARVALNDRKGAAQDYVRAADLLPENIEARLGAGTMMLARREFEDAQTLSEEVLALDKKNLSAMILRANAIAGLDDIETAIKEIHKAIKLDPTKSGLYANLGSLEASAGRLKEAEAAYLQAIAVEPSSSKAHAALGNFYWSNRRTADAERAFLKAVDLEPKDLLSHRILATFYSLAGRPHDATRPMKAIADLSGSVSDRLDLADHYLIWNQADEGLAILKEMAGREESFGAATLRIAAYHYAKGDPKEGHRLLDEVLAKNPGDAGGYLLRARFLIREGKTDEAIARASDAVKADPNLVDAHFFLAQQYQKQGDIRLAIASYSTVTLLSPRAATAQLQLSRLNLTYGNIDAAISLAEAASGNTGGDPAVRLVLVNALLTKPDYPRAESEIARLQRAYPKAPQVLTMAGNYHARMRNYAAARQAFEQSFAIDPLSIDTLSGLVAVDLAEKKFASARNRVEADVARNPKSVDRLLLAARTHGATDSLAAAEELLKRAAAADASSIEAFAMLGQFYYQQGRLDEGRREFEKLVDRSATRVSALTMLGIIHNREGRVDDAIRAYDLALLADAEAAVAANNLAWILASRGRELDRAMNLAAMAKRRIPGDPDVADTLGWIYHLKGIPRLAREILEECVALRPKNPQYHYHLGVVYASLKDTTKAMAELEQALQLSTTFTEAPDARRLLEMLKEGR